MTSAAPAGIQEMPDGWFERHPADILSREREEKKGEGRNVTISGTLPTLFPDVA